MIRRPPRSTQSRSSAASEVYKRQGLVVVGHQLVDLKRRKKLSGGRVVLIIVAIAVITLGIGKYGQRGAIVIWGQDDWIVSHLLMPLGISYFGFRLLQYVFDCLRGVIEENSLLRLAAFVMFIPTFPAGPLETYQGFYEKRSYSFDPQLFYKGLRRIALGYFKKVFVVDLVFVRAYFDLSAYTDLAIGFSALFGLRIMENFHLPFLSKNLGDFWRSWHISLSTLSLIHIS